MLCPVLLLALTAWSLIFLAPLAGRSASDQVLYHAPTIRVFASRWPEAPTRDELRGYLSATTPGYHLLLAPCAARLDRTSAEQHGPGGADRWLRVAASAFSLGVVGLLAWRIGAVLSRRPDRPGQPERTGKARITTRTLLCVLPLIASPYFLLAAVYLLPDNAGWLGVLAAHVLALSRIDRAEDPSSLSLSHRAGARGRALLWLLAAAACMVGVVLLRQSHLWVGGVLIAAAYLAPPPLPPPPPLPRSSPRSDSVADTGSNGPEFAGFPFDRLGVRLLSVGASVLSVLPAVLVFGWFVWLWRGPVPPRFQGQHAGANLATPALVLSLLGLYAVPLVGFIGLELSRLWREARWVLLAAGAAGVVLAALPRTTFQYPQRGSGLWGLVRAAESLGLSIAGHTSPVLLVLAPVGALALCAFLTAIGRRRPRAAWLYAATVAGFTLAQTANANAWQRYIEPGLLMFLALWCAEIWSCSSAREHEFRDTGSCGQRRIDWHRLGGLLRPIGLVALTLILAAITLVTQRAAVVIDPAHPPPIAPEVDMRPLDQLMNGRSR